MINPHLNFLRYHSFYSFLDPSYHIFIIRILLELILLYHILNIILHILFVEIIWSSSDDGGQIEVINNFLEIKRLET